MLLLLRALPRQEELNRDGEYRRSFYKVWGKVNAILCADETDAEYVPYTQSLSIKQSKRSRTRCR